MKLEAVGRITVGDLGLEVGRQVNNVDSAEWALLRTDTTTDTQTFGNESDLGGVVDFDAEFTGSDDGAGLFALLTTFLNQSVKIYYLSVMMIAYLRFAL